MVVIEMREAAQELAFDLVDEMKDLDRKRKLVLCELEETLYDCFEDEKEDEKEGSEERTEEGTDLGFKSKFNRHYAMRNFDEDEDVYKHRRRSLRHRRDRMGRFV